jgi:protoporphyrin/coproporphyrin ferrochelatase
MLNKKIAYIITGFSYPTSRQQEESFAMSLLEGKSKSKKMLPSLAKTMFTSKSPIKTIFHDISNHRHQTTPYDDIELLKQKLEDTTTQPVLTFHRHLTHTHKSFLSDITDYEDHTLLVLPLFPQFSYYFAGNISCFFKKTLPTNIINNMYFVKSFPTHPAFITSYQRNLKDLMEKQGLLEEETIFIFSSSSPPNNIADDIFSFESHLSYKYVLKAFPLALGKMGYQNGFFNDEDILSPTTISLVNNIEKWSYQRKNVVIIPLSLVVEDIHSIFEIDKHILLPLKKKGYNAHLCPCINTSSYWHDFFTDIFEDNNFVNSAMISPKS